MAVRSIILITMLGVVAFSTSCKVEAPLDPLTMKPSCDRCPQNYYHGYTYSCKVCASGGTSREILNLKTCPDGSCK